MLIYLDRDGLEQFEYFAEERSIDVQRVYCAVDPYQAILICRNGLDLYDLAEQTVDVQVDQEYGWRGYVRPGNEGKQHTKIVVYRVTRRSARWTLSEILAQAPRDDNKEMA